MAASIVESQVTWDTGAASKTVSVNTIVWSDEVALTVLDDAYQLQVSADNAGTPASGDTVTVYLARSTGDLLGDSGNDFDTAEHGEWVMTLDTYATNTPGEDPARKTVPVDLRGCTAVKVGVLCAQAASRSMVVRARMSRERPV